MFSTQRRHYPFCYRSIDVTNNNFTDQSRPDLSDSCLSNQWTRFCRLVSTYNYRVFAFLNSQPRSVPSKFLWLWLPGAWLWCWLSCWLCVKHLLPSYLPKRFSFQTKTTFCFGLNETGINEYHRCSLKTELFSTSRQCVWLSPEATLTGKLDIKIIQFYLV